LNVAWTTVQEHQHRISGIVAAYGDPLFNIADRDECGFFDSPGGSLCEDRSSEKN
jgi:hypothetical protein